MTQKTTLGQISKATPLTRKAPSAPTAKFPAAALLWVGVGAIPLLVEVIKACVVAVELPTALESAGRVSEFSMGDWATTEKSLTAGRGGGHINRCTVRSAESSS